MPTTQATHISRVQKMYALYQDGASLERVGKAYGITRERVRQLFDKAGLQRRSRAQASQLKRQTTTHNISRYIDEHRHDIIQTFRATSDIEAIAEQHGLSIRAVTAILKDALPAHEYRALRYKARAKEYTDDELICFLREAGDAQDGIVTITSYKQFANARCEATGARWPIPQTYMNRFGSWLNALEAAGMQANITYSWARKTFDVNDCVEAVRTAEEKLGKTPTSQQYDQCARASEGSLPSLATVGKRCGGWIAALQMAAG